MFRIKLLFLLLPLAINVKAVELVNDHTNRPETTWYENSLPTSYGHKSQDTTTVLPKQHVVSLDSSHNFSPVPLRHVPKPISYGSFGITKKLHTTPMSNGEGTYVTSPSSEKLYPNNFSGAPLRILSTEPPHMHKEEYKLRDDVIIVDPKAQHMKLMAKNNFRNELKSNENLWRPLPTSVERNNHFHESGTSAPLREVPKTYRYEVPTATTTTNRPDYEVSEFVTYPSTEQKLDNAMSAFKETEKPTLNEKIVEVTPDLTSSTELPTTVTVMRPNGMPLTTASLLVQPQSDVTIPNRKTSTMYQGTSSYDRKELRLDFSCDGIDAFYSIEKNCDKFVECKDNVAKLYRCPPGLHFNPRTVWPAEPCAEKYISRCDTSPDPTVTPILHMIVIALELEDYKCNAGDGYYSHESKCEQFIGCKGNVATLYECPSGLHFNSKTKYGEIPCDIPSIAQCHKSESKFSAALVSRTVADYVCPSSHGYFKIANDCEKFIKCERSIASSYKCLTGLQFNPKSLWGKDPCESPSVIRCNHNIPPLPRFSAYFVGTLEDYTCPFSHGYYKIDNNCEQFIKCEVNMNKYEHSNASIHQCVTGMQFNQNAAWEEDPCASVSIIRCHGRNIPPEPKFSATLVGRVDYTCPSSHAYYKRDNSCEEFIKCEQFIAFSYKCLHGLQFNHNAKFGEDPCDKEAIIRCHADSIPPEPKFSAVLVGRIESYVCPSSRGYFRIENDCEQFVKCEGFTASKYKCHSGLQFNYNAAWEQDPCASKSVVRCHVKIIEPTPKLSAILISKIDSYNCPSSNGYYGIDNDCEQFVRCEMSVASKYKCFPGLQYNHNAAWKEDPCASEAIIRCRVKTPEPTFSATLIGKLESFTCPSSHGYYKRENNCKEFVKCEHSIALSYKCHNGLQFNHNAEFGEDPCAKESIIRCHSHVIPPEPKFSAVLVSRMEGYVCPLSSGYFKIENDCEQFIKCEQSTAYKYKCFSGLQFKHEAALEQDPCASESIVRCQVKIIPPEPNVSASLITKMENYMCPSSNGYYRLDDDCKQFIKCERSIAYSYKCFDGLQFNHHATWGEDPCAKESIILCDAETTHPVPTFSATLVSKMEGHVCSSSYGYYRIENDCEQFIKCERSIASKFKCFPGMQYNNKAVWGQDPCASESIVRCSVKSPLKFSAVLITRLEQYVCPATNGYFRLAANDCEQFVQCENSHASSYKCLAGLQFNQNALWGEDPCALPAVARCEIEVITPAILITPHIDYICGTSDGYFRKEGECEQFIECKHNVPSLYKCPSGLQFNSNARWGENPCARASVVRCQVKHLSYTLITKYPPGYTCPKPTGYFSVEAYCEQFIECQNNVPSLYVCQNGLHFNRYVAWGADPCAPRTVARCKPHHSKTPISPDNDLCPHANGYFPLDDTECSKYVVCENGVSKIMPCPSGLVFNATLEACDWPVNVPSCHPNVFENLGFTCPSPVVKDGAYDEEITHFRYGESCKLYIACQEGRPRLLGCDPGKYFDEETRHCIDSSLVHNCKDL